MASLLLFIQVFPRVEFPELVRVLLIAMSRAKENQPLEHFSTRQMDKNATNALGHLAERTTPLKPNRA